MLSRRKKQKLDCWSPMDESMVMLGYFWDIYKPYLTDEGLKLDLRAKEVMSNFTRIFRNAKLNVIGMVHVEALPGTPGHQLSVDQICEKACKEAKALTAAGVDGIIVENMHDIPYVKSKYVGPEVIACMTRICAEVKREVPTGFPCGLQILAAANKEAIAVAHATGFQFIRVEGFVFGHVADEGWIDGCAGSLLRYRKNIGAEDVAIFADIKKKHSSHAVTADVSLVETAEAAQFFMADGVIVTGTATGRSADPRDMEDIQKECHGLPVLIGSGVTPDNAHLFKTADGLIVGSYFKKDGRWQNPLDTSRISRFMETVRNIRQNI